jgi:hypothetical protein
LVLWAVFSLILEVAWSGVFFIGAFCLANIAVKLFQPSNTVMQDTSWALLLITSAVAMIGVFLLERPRLLGDWTLTVVFGFLLIYGMGMLISLSRSQAGSSRERRHGPD